MWPHHLPGLPDEIRQDSRSHLPQVPTALHRGPVLHQGQLPSLPLSGGQALQLQQWLHHPLCCFSEVLLQALRVRRDGHLPDAESRRGGQDQRDPAARSGRQAAGQEAVHARVCHAQGPDRHPGDHQDGRGQQGRPHRASAPRAGGGQEPEGGAGQDDGARGQRAGHGVPGQRGHPARPGPLPAGEQRPSVRAGGEEAHAGHGQEVHHHCVVRRVGRVLGGQAVPGREEPSRGAGSLLPHLPPALEPAELSDAEYSRML